MCASPVGRAIPDRHVEISPGLVELVSASRSEHDVLTAGQALVRVLACGICGTDLHVLHGMRLPPGASYPVRPGHEVCGIVERVARLDDDTEGVAVGDMVVLHPVDPCGHCDMCGSGSEQLCPRGEILGIHRPGGLADYVVWPMHRMVVVRDIAPIEAAVLSDAVATAYRAARLADLSAGGRACVLGAGGVGTHVLQILQILHPSLTLVGVVRSLSSRDRLEAAGFEAEIHDDLLLRRVRERHGSFDAVIDFTGESAAPALGIRLLRAGGTLVLGSVLDGDLNTGPAVAVQSRELTVRGAYASSIDDLRAAVELASTGQLDLSRSVSHVRRLDDVENAFAELEARPAGLVRMVLTTDEAPG